MPVAFCIGTATLASLLTVVDPVPAVSTVAQRLAGGLDSFTLLAIPFFILAGNLMAHGGIAQRLIAFARALVGVAARWARLRQHHRVDAVRRDLGLGDRGGGGHRWRDAPAR